MEWSKLLSSNRLGKEKKQKHINQKRSEFQRDFDRIVFSDSFRRLQDKTQVFPLSNSDYPRTRLTHSLEVAIIGRSLGIEVGFYLEDERKLQNFDESISPYDIGAIVASACLAHDIGNPPFGHSGEEAIQNWFEDNSKDFLKYLDDNQRWDFLCFEGNAQGFRILTKLQGQKENGGMQLTLATLGAFTKYPRESFNKNEENLLKGVSSKKHGFYQDQKTLFQNLMKDLQIKEKVPSSAWFRHPLAFLVEAADDICYKIIDLEDGFLVKEISLKEVEGHLLPIAGGEINNDVYEKLKPQQKVEYLRAKSMGKLIGVTVEIFKEREKELLEGSFDDELLDVSEVSGSLKALSKFNKKNIYKLKDVVAVEMAGYQVIAGLLDLFVPAAFELILKGKKANSKSRKVAEYLLPKKDFDELKGNNPYDALLWVTDYVAGMSDSFAVATYKQITGISLPSR